MRLIDADALKQIICSNVYPVQDYFNSRDYGMFWTGGIEKAIDEAPAVDTTPVQKGRWETVRLNGAEWTLRCSECKMIGFTSRARYCPNCGAKMEEDDETDRR